ncbi:MAG TPA: polysaccharide deacetylase family protein, partial [Chitinophagaceae bacterium]|nr:polysaccharide deacetylase family protein [Chitinophagaceae bacterium]
MKVFRKYNIRSTIYACSGIVMTTRKFWFRYPGLNVRQLKKMDHGVRLECIKFEGYSIEECFIDDERQAINGSELLEMRDFVDFQSHTRFHPILTTCTEAEVRAELMESRQELQEKTGKPVFHFAYPNGDYSPREIRLLKEAGYKSARTT